MCANARRLRSGRPAESSSRCSRRMECASKRLCQFPGPVSSRSVVDSGSPACSAAFINASAVKVLVIDPHRNGVCARTFDPNTRTSVSPFLANTSAAAGTFCCVSKTLSFSTSTVSCVRASAAQTRIVRQKHTKLRQNSRAPKPTPARLARTVSLRRQAPIKDHEAPSGRRTQQAKS